MQATLTSVLFQLVYKNKYPARNCVQNSRRCQNKFIPFNISRVTANPRWPSGSLLPKCIITLAQINAHQKQLSSPYKWNLNNTFPMWKYSVYNLSHMIWLINFKLNKIKLPKDSLKFSWLYTCKGWLLMACEWNLHLKKSHSRNIPQNTWVVLLRTVKVIKNKLSLRNHHSQDDPKATE